MLDQNEHVARIFLLLTIRPGNWVSIQRQMTSLKNGKGPNSIFDLTYLVT